MSRIFLVQSASDLKGGGGYCRGLLEAEQQLVLVSYVDYFERLKRLTIFDPNPLRKRPVVEKPQKRVKLVD